MTKEEVLKEIIDEMSIGIFIGKYDAKHGNISFMNGVETVMEYLAYSVSDEYGKKFNAEFTKNILDSQQKV